MTSLLVQELRLSTSQQRAIQKRAREQGISAAEYVRSLIERDLLASQSFDEILRPIREDVRKSGMTERDLDAIVERARKAASRRHRVHKAQRP